MPKEGEHFLRQGDIPTVSMGKPSAIPSCQASAGFCKAKNFVTWLWSLQADNCRVKTRHKAVTKHMVEAAQPSLHIVQFGAYLLTIELCSLLTHAVRNYSGWWSFRYLQPYIWNINDPNRVNTLLYLLGWDHHYWHDTPFIMTVFNELNYPKGLFSSQVLAASSPQLRARVAQLDLKIQANHKFSRYLNWSC